MYNNYLKIEKLPLALKNEELIMLFMKMQNGDLKAREKIICHNLRLVAHRVRKFRNISDDIDDLFSIGTIGLMKAVDLFDVSKNIKFSTFACRIIDNEFLMLIRKSKHTISTISLSAPKYSSEDDTSTNTDYIADDIDIDERYITKEEKEELHQAIKNLSDDEQEIIYLYYGFYSRRYRQEEIANLYGITQSVLSRRIKKINSKVRFFLTGNYSDINKSELILTKVKEKFGKKN